MDLEKRVASGDRDALSAVVHQHYADVLRLCSRLVGGAAEDAAQDTFLQASRKIGSFRGDSSIRTWLFGIAINVCRNRRRKKVPLPLADWKERELEAPAAPLFEAHALRTALAKLGKSHREVLILHVVVGLTYADCAGVLRVRVGSVKSRLHHATRKLRGYLVNTRTGRDDR
jgi:RNA polymerase sigma factor (sigma-70 family)